MARIDPNSCDDNCPVRRAMDVVAGKWTLLIVRDLLGGTRRFGELQVSVGAVTPKVLTDRLRHLEEAGVIRRTAHPEIPPRVEYDLTDLGRRLKPAINALAGWGADVRAASDAS